LPKVATQWNSRTTRDSNRGHRARIFSALTMNRSGKNFGGVRCSSRGKYDDDDDDDDDDDNDDESMQLVFARSYSIKQSRVC